MDSIQSSLSSAEAAQMVYAWCFPSTTRPSVSVLHALIFLPWLLGLYSSKQYYTQVKGHRLAFNNKATHLLKS